MSYPTSSAPSLMPSTGNGGSHGDLRERVRALEVGGQHLERYVLDRTHAHHSRMLVADEKLGRLADRMTAVERTAHTAETAAAAAAVKIDALHQQATEARALEAARAQSKSDRRAARKEAASLLIWLLAALTTIVGVIGSLTGWVPHDKLQALEHVKPLLKP